MRTKNMLGFVFILFVSVVLVSLWPKVHERYYNMETNMIEQGIAPNQSVDTIRTHRTPLPNETVIVSEHGETPIQKGIAVNMPSWWTPDDENARLAHGMGRARLTNSLPTFMPMVCSSNAMLAYAASVARSVRVVGQNETNFFSFDSEQGLPALIETIRSVYDQSRSIDVVDEDGNVVLVPSLVQNSLEIGLPAVMNFRVGSAKLVSIIPTADENHQPDNVVRRDWTRLQGDTLPFNTGLIGKRGLYVARANGTSQSYQLWDGQALVKPVASDIPPFLRRR